MLRHILRLAQALRHNHSTNTTINLKVQPREPGSLSRPSTGSGQHDILEVGYFTSFP